MVFFPLVSFDNLCIYSGTVNGVLSRIGLFHSLSLAETKVSQHKDQANAITESALRAVKVVQAFDLIERLCSVQRLHLERASKLGICKAVVSALELGAVYFTVYAANGLAFFTGSQMAASGALGDNSGTIYAVVFLIVDASFVVGPFAP